MKHIVKDSRNEPKALLRYRATPGAKFSGYVDKDLDTGEEKPLKTALAREQFGICCYCMRRIRVSEMTVEHYITQNHHPSSPLSSEAHSSKTLDYQNLLGSCNTAVRDCSGIRGNTWIQIDPRKLDCESLVRIGRNGQALSSNATINSEINTILKLNQGNLAENRRQVIDLANERLRRHAPTPARAVQLFSSLKMAMS